MKGVYRNIFSSLWDDPDFIILSPNAKFVFVNLRTSRFNNMASIYIYYLEPIVSQTGLSTREVERCLDELQRTKWIAIDGRLLWIRNGLKFDASATLTNQFHRAKIKEILSELPKSKLVVEFCNYYGIDLPEKYRNAIPTDPYEIATPPGTPPATPPGSEGGTPIATPPGSGVTGTGTGTGTGIKFCSSKKPSNIKITRNELTRPPSQGSGNGNGDGEFISTPLQFVSLYNEYCKNLSRASPRISPDRAKKINLRLKSCNDLAWWIGVFQKANLIFIEPHKGFPNGWKPSLPFLIHNDENAIKIEEGSIGQRHEILTPGEKWLIAKEEQEKRNEERRQTAVHARDGKTSKPPAIKYPADGETGSDTS